jgi:hypothetical protein
MLGSLCLAILFVGSRADFPMHCLQEQSLGVWELSLSRTTTDRGEIGMMGEPYSLRRKCFLEPGGGGKTRLTLLPPNIVEDAEGNTGTWTMVDDQVRPLYLRNCAKLHYHHHNAAYYFRAGRLKLTGGCIFTSRTFNPAPTLASLSQRRTCRQMQMTMRLTSRTKMLPRFAVRVCPVMPGTTMQQHQGRSQPTGAATPPHSSNR